MKYRLVKVEFIQNPKRLYRELYVKEDLNLEELGCLIVSSLYGAFAHEFLFKTKEHSYLPLSFLADDVMDGDCYMGDFKFADINGSMLFVYDTGEGYTFKVSVAPISVDINSRDIVIVEKAIGLGIWEDNINGLYNYLSGKVKPSTKRKGEDDFRFPWNINIKTLGEWDNFDKDAFFGINEFAIKEMKRYQKNEQQFKKDALRNLK